MKDYLTGDRAPKLPDIGTGNFFVKEVFFFDESLDYATQVAVYRKSCYMNNNIVRRIRFQIVKLLRVSAA